MRVCVLTFLAATALFGADEQRLALSVKSQADFERVFRAPAPQLRDTNLCIQTQAGLIPVATPEELPLVHFRKGWCTLAAAAITREAGAFQQAVGEFDLAAATWPARNLSFGKKRPPEPEPSVFPVLASIARLQSGARTKEDNAIAAAIAVHDCPASVMPADGCAAVFETGRKWLGWSDLQRDDIAAAARDFPQSATSWTSWVAGKRAFRDRKYADAAAAYRRAVEIWEQQSRMTNLPLLDRMAPSIPLSSASTELGGAQLLAGDSAGAIATLNQAVSHDLSNARALYLRGRARDAAGQRDAALADYSLAARNALAKADDQASGEAHLYRGVSLYRRRDYMQAQDEFTSVLNFEITPEMRADAVAWRRLAAVAEGSCESGRKLLEEALAAASPYFPREEARSVMAACSATSSTLRPEQPMK